MIRGEFRSSGERVRCECAIVLTGFLLGRRIRYQGQISTRRSSRRRLNCRPGMLPGGRCRRRRGIRGRVLGCRGTMGGTDPGQSHRSGLLKCSFSLGYPWSGHEVQATATIPMPSEPGLAQGPASRP